MGYRSAENILMPYIYIAPSRNNNPKMSNRLFTAHKDHFTYYRNVATSGLERSSHSASIKLNNRIWEGKQYRECEHKKENLEPEQEPLKSGIIKDWFR